ncbi:MAG TPA: sigma-70 family RNA polymerase sigma factor [Syntrophales bacterium]|jgi:RNA polymerase sigma-70 factor (ECF subfamily)|nr:sigma-70 family RNA polymerase sigma factor [Syntrophales bacterium]
MADPADVPANRPVDDPDAEAVARCLAGRTDAFEALVERHQKRMLNLAYRMLGDYDEACDVVQESFLSAWRGLPKFRREARFSTWLHEIVLNVTRNRLKQVQARSRHEAPAADNTRGEDGECLPCRAVSPLELPSERLERKEREAKVQECIGTLEGEYREVLVLRDIQGFSYEEIGDMLKVPGGTVRSRLFRARSAMKDCLSRLLGKER